jgi:hypothetical protein
VVGWLPLRLVEHRPIRIRRKPQIRRCAP